MRKSLVLVPILLALGIFPAFAQVQSPRSVPLIGVFVSNPKYFETRMLKALRELGYIEGKNMAIESKLAKVGRQRSGAAAELVRLRPDVIITSGTGPTRAMKRATQTIPVVFHLYRDPVRIGLVESFARPGGNITGVTGSQREIKFKMLELFKESFPGISRLGIVRRHGKPIRGRLEIEARALGLQLQIVQIKLGKGLDENDDALLGLDREKVDGIILGGGRWYRGHFKRIVKLVEKSKLPAIYRGAHWARMGGLMTYDIDKQDLRRRVAYLVDRILKGAKPGNLPVERPMKTKFVINLKTAKRQGFNIPPEVLMFADEVIR